MVRTITPTLATWSEVKPDVIEEEMETRNHNLFKAHVTFV